MEKLIKQFLSASAETKLKIVQDRELLNSISRAADLLLTIVERQGTVYICGNGGSACDAMHFCEELVAKYKRERAGIRAQHLCDPAILTCWGNDYDFDSVFSRQIETLCSDKDILVVLSTSGNSKNIVEAVLAAKKINCPVIGMTGRTGGKLKDLVDILINVPADTSDRIQECHITLIHTFCEILETSEASQRIPSYTSISGENK